MSAGEESEGRLWSGSKWMYKLGKWVRRENVILAIQRWHKLKRFIYDTHVPEWTDRKNFGQWMCRVIKHSFTLIGSFISLVWTSDPIVGLLTAGVLDREDGLYVVNTLIHRHRPLLHMFTLVQSLIWPERPHVVLHRGKGWILGWSGTSVWSG